MIKRYPLALIFFILAVSPSLALGPMYSFRDLVAGEGAAGLENGPFDSALFNQPSGLAVDSAQNKLYVADKGNHCIRVIDLSGENQVDTLVGTGKAGFADGSFPTVQFNGPTLVLCLPHGQMAVVDQGNYRIRLVDLEKKTVSTLAGNGTAESKDGTGPLAQIGSVWSLAYLESANALYFSEPQSGSLRRLSLKTGEVKTLLKGDPRLPKPGALCADGEKIYAADREAALGFQLTPHSGGDDFDWVPLNCRAKTLCLAWTDKALYSLQSDDQDPLTRLLPGPRSVGHYDCWGEPLAHFTRSMLLSEAVQGIPLGLVCDPAAPRRFFLVHPTLNIVTSLRDLDQGDLMGNETLCNDLMDLDYPTTKPPRVFRILLIGDSHVFHNDNPDKTSVNNRMTLMAKKLELDLNMAAALGDGPDRFEVLTLASNSHFPLNLWPYYRAPPVVQKYGVDMVLLLQEPPSDDYLSIYFDRPLTREHIPALEMDPEYLLKPEKDKTLDPTVKDLVDLCLAKKWASLGKEGRVQFGDHAPLLQDPETRAKMIELYARPLKALREKISGFKTRDGLPVRMVVCLMPKAYFHSFRAEKPFWEGAVNEIGGSVIDLSGDMTAFRLSFYPLSEDRDNDHHNGHGHEFVAFLVARELVKEKWIPMERESKNTK